MATTLSARTNSDPMGTPHGRSSSAVSVSSHSNELVSRENQQVMLPDIKRSDRALDKNKPLPTSLQSDFIPDDILQALTHPVPPNEKLGPLSRYRNLNTSDSQSRKPPANVWNFPKRRDQYKHLTKNTTCICGAGKDISFLYDVPKKMDELETPAPQDHSGVRAQEIPKTTPKHQLQLPDTLIPEEYHIVKNKGVMGLEYHEDKFTNKPEDHENHLVMFPSMNPTSRYEVLQLKKAMEDMLEKIGLNEEGLEVTGPTQMHALLELIKKEQNIYNIVFHELIRQVSVECLERGQLLSNLRGKYSDILNKIPKQVKGLHEEVMAQRALDRRLTEELMRFKSTIGILTSELSDVKEHDRRVTQEANKAKDDLKSALTDAQKNASLLAEYHDLYELQRQRLEKQVFVLADEKEIWSGAAYSLALKVTEEHSLNTAKRLHVCEKSWAKLAKHFTIRLSDADTGMLTKLQSFVETFRDRLDEFSTNQKLQENEMVEQLKNVKVGLQKWISDFERNVFDKEGHLKKAPDAEKTTALYKDVKQWEELLNHEGEKYSGDEMLTGQEKLQLIRRQMDGWTDTALKVFNRHREEDGEPFPDYTTMIALNETVEGLLIQLQVRLMGENGVAKGMIHLANSFETWDARLNTVLHGNNPLADSDWNRFYQLMDDWIVHVDETLECIGQSQKLEDREEEKPHTRIEVQDVLRQTQKWMSSTTNGIDSEDAKLVEQVANLHTEMVKWMVQMLLRLAPDRKENSKEAAEAALLGSTSVGQLQSNAKSLFDQLSAFSNYVMTCCMGIVSAEMQRRQDAAEENADQEYKDLQRLKTEADEWVHSARLMLCQLTGEPMPDPSDISLLGRRDTLTEFGSEADQDQRKPSMVAFVDKEKLETQPEEKEAETDGGTEQQTEGDAAAEAATEEDADNDPAAEPENKEQDESSATDAQQVELLTEPAEVQPLEEEQEAETDAEEEEEDGVEKLEVIGYDESTHIRKLDQQPDQAPIKESQKIAPKFYAGKDRESPPDAQRAFEALAAVDTLQDQLINTEERAQVAEERASLAEMELVKAQERIRALERRLAGTPASSEAGSTAGTKPKQLVPPSPAPEDTQEKPAGESSPEKEKEKSPPKKDHSRSSSRSSTKSKKK